MTELQVPAITAKVLAAFARASGDDNVLHRDLAAARAAGLDQVPAHGMLSMAYLARLVTTTRPQEQLVSISVRFVTTTPLGAAPTFHTTATDKDSVAVEGRLEDGTVTVRGTARYGPKDDTRGTARNVETGSISRCIQARDPKIQA